MIVATSGSYSSRVDSQSAGDLTSDEEGQLYTITVTRTPVEQEQVVYSQVMEYEIKDAVLTLAFSDDHDLVIPLFQVTTVDILRQE